MDVPGGKGYCPTDLVNAGQLDEAARIAKLAFDRRL